MSWLRTAVTCGILHHLLTYHYLDVCRPSWWFVGANATTYCVLVDRALQLFRVVPLVAALTALPALPGLPGLNLGAHPNDRPAALHRPL
jgi:hypothetical protein